MTFSHDDANARLLDLVYGEGNPAERAALEAHVATCARCTADLAALGATRATLRTALDDAPVPARAHARILEAATQAMAPVAAAAAAVAPVAAAAAPARLIVSPRPSLWERLRGRWTLPTFATVGALAIVVIGSKVFLEPQKTMERGKEAATSAAPPPAAPVYAPSYAKAPPEPAATAPSDEGGPTGHFRPGSLGSVSEKRAKAGGGGRPGLLGPGTLAQRLSHAHGASGSAAGLDSLDSVRGGSVGGLASGSSRGIGVAPAAPMPPKSKSLDDLLEGTLQNKPSANAQPARGAAREEFAPPPSGWKGGAPAGAPAPAAAAPPPPVVASQHASKKATAAPPPSTRGRADDNPLDFGDADQAYKERSVAASSSLAKQKRAPADEPKSASAPPREAPAQQQAEKVRKYDEQASQAQGKAEAAPAKDKSPAVQEADNELKRDGASQETLARRADQLFAAHRWSEAIAAYRELLRRYPDADLKPRWRARITQAQAEVDTTAAPAAAQKASKKASQNTSDAVQAAPAK